MFLDSNSIDTGLKKTVCSVFLFALVWTMDLYQAAINNNRERVKLLLEQGDDKDKVDSEGLVCVCWGPL